MKEDNPVNSRERVWIALRREGLPDRVPLQFDLSRQLLERFSQKHGIPVHYTQAYYEDVTYRISGNELRIAMGSDCVLVGGGLPRGYSHPVDEDGYMVNEFGMKMRQGPLYMELVEHPMAHVKTPEDVEAFPFPDPLAEGRFDDAEMTIKKYRGKYFIWGDVEVTVFALARNLVGMEKLLVDMALGEPYVEALLDKCEDFSLAVARRLVSLGVDGILGGDDYGAQNGMLISPGMWRQYFKEGHRAFYDKLKSLNPDLIIAHHCDGAVAPIIEEWVEAGLEVFNPVQPNVPGHEPEDLKARYGATLSFWGAIDQQQLLPFGTPQEIEAETRRIINILGEGGGYLASPAHIIQADTPVENVEAFISAVKTHGVY
jgi:uroporphyrinogen decarboxylase